MGECLSARAQGQTLWSMPSATEEWEKGKGLVGKEEAEKRGGGGDDDAEGGGEGAVGGRFCRATLGGVFRSLDLYGCVCRIICIKLEETVTTHRRVKRPICAPRRMCDEKMTFQNQMSLPQS